MKGVNTKHCFSIFPKMNSTAKESKPTSLGWGVGLPWPLMKMSWDNQTCSKCQDSPHFLSSKKIHAHFILHIIVFFLENDISRYFSLGNFLPVSWLLVTILLYWVYRLWNTGWNDERLTLAIRCNIRAVSFLGLGVTVFPERNIIFGVTGFPERKIT